MGTTIPLQMGLNCIEWQVEHDPGSKPVSRVPLLVSAASSCLEFLSCLPLTPHCSMFVRLNKSFPPKLLLVTVTEKHRTRTLTMKEREAGTALERQCLKAERCGKRGVEVDRKAVDLVRSHRRILRNKVSSGKVAVLRSRKQTKSTGTSQ